MKHIVYRGEQELGWVDGSMLSGREAGEILFDSVFLKYRGRNYKLGEIKVGFDRADIFSKPGDKGTAQWVGFVNQQGEIFAGEELFGRVEQDVWSEMYANAGGAALLLLLCNEPLVLDAKQRIEAQLREEEGENSAACRESHSFRGKRESEKQAPPVQPAPPKSAAPRKEQNFGHREKMSKGAGVVVAISAFVLFLILFAVFSGRFGNCDLNVGKQQQPEVRSYHVSTYMVRPGGVLREYSIGSTGEDDFFTLKGREYEGKISFPKIGLEEHFAGEYSLSGQTYVFDDPRITGTVNRIEVRFPAASISADFEVFFVKDF